MDWLSITRADSPLILSMPHTGIEMPPAIEARLVSPGLGRHDADWHIEKLYTFEATIIRTQLSRTVVDVNRDPSGKSLYPGQATTDLCPTTTFDGDPLYPPGQEPSAEDIAERTRLYHAPYHAALAAEIGRLRKQHDRVVVYDCHSIRSKVPRLFDGELPNFNIGSNSGRSCDRALTQAIEAACDRSPFSRVTNGRFKGGYITRSLGRPETGVHAVQMELAMRGYLDEDLANWPPQFDVTRAAPMRAALGKVLQACLEFAD